MSGQEVDKPGCITLCLGCETDPDSCTFFLDFSSQFLTLLTAPRDAESVIGSALVEQAHNICGSVSFL